MRLAFRVLVFALLASPAWAGDQQTPLPEMVVAKTSRPPVIDGTISPGEWDQASACTGFVTAFSNNLARCQSTAWITYDDKFIYVCIRNLRGEWHSLLHKSTRKPDDEHIVNDDANEIWFSPPGAPPTTYQTILNSYPAIYDCLKIPSLGSTQMSCRANGRLPPRRLLTVGWWRQKRRSAHSA